MHSWQAARRYARAFFDSAKSAGVLDAADADVQTLSGLLADSEDLRRFIADPVLTKQQKQQAIDRLFANRLSPLVFKFLLFLIDKRRLNLTADICEAFHHLYLENKKIAHIEITSAFPMESSEVEAICQRLKEKFRQDISPKVSTDPALIGGFKVKTDDQVYDFSLVSQLEKFRQSIRNI